MSLETWQTISNVAVFLGVVLAGAGGLGGYYFGQRIAAEKDKQAQAEQAGLSGKIQTLLEGNAALQTRLGPFEELARRQFPGKDPDTALGELQQKLETLGTRTDKLESAVAPRRLSSSLTEQLAAHLRKGGKQSVTIMTVLGDGEAIALSQSVKAALAQAGWDVKIIDGVVFHTPFYGVTISVATAPGPPGAAILQSALSAAGIEVRGNVDSGQDPGEVKLIIGSKAQ